MHVYSIGYMHEDPRRPRFFAYLSLFTFAMLMLVTADNLVQMFFGWEGVGLASYLLIGFWYEKPSANAAAIKAFVVNRVGDFGFALGIFLYFKLTHSVTFDEVFAAAPGLEGQTIHIFGLDVDALTLACLLAVHGRDGQIGAIPAAHLVAGRDGRPDSGLGAHSRRDHGHRRRVHGGASVAALRICAGRAGLRHRSSAPRRHSSRRPSASCRTTSSASSPIRPVRSSATCSSAVGVGGYSLGIFHLFTHAFFKALLFLGAGSVIIAMHHEQDMRNMGGLRKDIPFTFAMMLIGTLALTGVGIPHTELGFAGFFSKDAIIEAAYAAGQHSHAAMFGFVSTVVAAGLTSFYSWRLLFMTFFGRRADHGAAHGHDAHATRGSRARRSWPRRSRPRTA